MTLNRLISDSSKLEAEQARQAGITFVSASGNSGSGVGIAHHSEVLDFVQRCIESIEESPESMRAGLSSLLLKKIAISSEQLQTVIVRNVYLKLLDQVASPDVRIVN